MSILVSSGESDDEWGVILPPAGVGGTRTCKDPDGLYFNYFMNYTHIAKH